ncbi:MAG: hypothetical protein QOG64_2249 [Acidimicrobiaceae bacterium]|nr:hypothetical protein [Acidimicrobiaceae bacterium]
MEGFDEFFGREYAGVVRSLVLAVGDLGRAEDAAQEAFALAYVRWRTVRTMARPVAWVYVVASRRAIDRHRHDGHDFETVPVADGAGAADDVATSLSLRTSLAALPVRQRQAVVLRFLADLSIDEVAQAMQCAPGTVKSTVHAALARLRVELDEDPDGR